MHPKDQQKKIWAAISLHYGVLRPSHVSGGQIGGTFNLLLDECHIR
jgi:hypothetical protein